MPCDLFANETFCDIESHNHDTQGKKWTKTLYVYTHGSYMLSHYIIASQLDECVPFIQSGFQIM